MNKQIGTTIVRYRDERGKLRKWRVACLIPRDTVETIRKHVAAHRPQLKVVSIEIQAD